MVKIAAALLLLGVALAVSVTLCAGRQEVVRVKDGARIGFDRMTEEVRPARVIFVGESHTSMSDHRLELGVIRALHDRGVPLSIGMEMFSADSQPMLDAWVAGNLRLDRFVQTYSQDWQMPWRYYRAILFYARDRKIPVIGLNVPEDIPAKVAHQGFGALTPAERAKIPSGITCTVDAPYREFIRRAFREHAPGEQTFTRFCEAQMLWNKVMAWRLADYLKRYPQRTVVVIAGTGHTLKRAIPWELAQVFPVRAEVIMPRSSGLTPSSVTINDTDYLVVK